MRDISLSKTIQVPGFEMSKDNQALVSALCSSFTTYSEVNPTRAKPVESVLPTPVPSLHNADDLSYNALEDTLRVKLRSYSCKSFKMLEKQTQ